MTMTVHTLFLQGNKIKYLQHNFKSHNNIVILQYFRDRNFCQNLFVFSKGAIVILAILTVR